MASPGTHLGKNHPLLKRRRYLKTVDQYDQLRQKQIAGYTLDPQEDRLVNRVSKWKVRLVYA